MKNWKNLFALAALLALAALVAGCAGRSGSSVAQPQAATISAERMDNVITYTNDMTGKNVTVSVCESYEYMREIDKELGGVTIKGHLYSNGGESGILVTKLPRADFEKLVKITLDAPMTGIKAYPPKTIYKSRFCELIRAYVVTFDGEVVAAIKAKGLDADNPGCGNWISLDDAMAEAPELVVEFDQSADGAIHMEWK